MGKAVSADLKLTGDYQLNQLLKNALPKEAKSSMKQAMNAAATPMLKAARKLVRTDTELLKKSLKKKTKTYRSGTTVALIGADRSVIGERYGKKAVPANYIHLVDQGHRGPAPAPAYPFRQPAYDAHKAESQNIATAKLATALTKKAKARGDR